MKLKIIAWALVLLLAVQLVVAIGIRPAKTTLISENARDYSEKFWIVNNEGREFLVDVYVEGEMGEYITLKEKTISFRSDDEAKAVEFEVHLPEDVPPGISTANIVVEEKLTGTDPKNVISSKIVLKHKIIIEGPYPDKYIKAKLNFHEQSNTIKFVSEVENLGKLDIDQIKTTFYVNDKEQQQQILETETTTLPKKENKLLSAEIARDAFELGEFEVSAVTKYDDQQVELVQKLLVGRPEVDITYFDKYFVANKINQYAMELLNKWNQKVENVYVDVEIKKDDQKIDQFRTKSVDIEGEMVKRINDYFDARGKVEGKYVFEMVINFWNSYRMDQKTFEVELLTDEEFKDVSSGNMNAALVGNAAGSGGNGALWTIMGILLGILAVAGIYIGYRYRHRKEFE